ncbi:ATP synthase epsilon chain [Buchnera aphidicola (Periphyllus testudinaceus)]|uniref:ATP synthase F1 subunit epsilon n=1 Tax=Buchnera aphidicola TaxID=9 RepID=UPI003464820D
MCFRLNIVSFKRSIFSKNVKSAKIKGIKGNFSIYPNHSPLLTFIRSGLISILNNKGNKEYIYVSKGIFEMKSKISNILVKYAFFLKDLNKNKLINKKNKIEENYKNIKDIKLDIKINKKYQNILKKIEFVKKINKFK